MAWLKLTIAFSRATEWLIAGSTRTLFFIGVVQPTLSRAC